MQNDKSKFKIIFAFLIAILIFAFLFLIWVQRKGNDTAGELDAFAQCLADKGAVMYGADWCGHCQSQKKMFGDSFRFIPYVECPEDPKRCLSAGIQGYPTWIFSNGRRLEGEQSIEKLSQESGCAMPNSKL